MSKEEKNSELKFYKCNICGNIVCKIEDSGMPLNCCGKQMMELRPESTDGALEKHVPVYCKIGDEICVKVGEVLHPMEDFHHIVFVALHTDKGFYVHSVAHNDEPTTCFCIGEDEKVLGVYDYCNLHGMYVNHECRKDCD